MILDAAETVLRLFGFDRTVYGMPRENRKRKWYNELHEERTKDIQTEATLSINNNYLILLADADSQLIIKQVHSDCRVIYTVFSYCNNFLRLTKLFSVVLIH